jgi:hypothetical protein
MQTVVAMVGQDKAELGVHTALALLVIVVTAVTALVSLVLVAAAAAVLI